MEECDRLKDPKSDTTIPLNIESLMNERPTRAETHLNVCAVLSDLGKHELACKHAMNAVLMIQTQIIFDFVPGCGPDNIWPAQTISCTDWTD